jgi:hypothetical protein
MNLAFGGNASPEDFMRFAAEAFREIGKWHEVSADFTHVASPHPAEHVGWPDCPAQPANAPWQETVNRHPEQEIPTWREVRVTQFDDTVDNVNNSFYTRTIAGPASTRRPIGTSTRSILALLACRRSAPTSRTGKCSLAPWEFECWGAARLVGAAVPP